MNIAITLLLISAKINIGVSQLKEFSLARYSDIAVYANNSVIDFNLVGEGYPGIKQTDGGALECHTDDTTCCRGIDNPPNGTGKGEWYYSNGTVVPPPGNNSDVYRSRGFMVIRLNRGNVYASTVGVYCCQIPGTGGNLIKRCIELRAAGKYIYFYWENLYNYIYTTGQIVIIIQIQPINAMI